MKAFAKTLFGDARNLATVAAIVAVTAILARLGFSREAAYAMPVMIVCAVAWLAHH